MPDDFDSAILAKIDHESTQPFVVRPGESSAVPSLREAPPDPLSPKRYSDRVEVKLDYAIDTQRYQTHYRVETYFFLPRSLGLDAHTYSRDEFYTDMHAYIRFKEPSIPASVVSDLADPSSPLHRARALIQAAGGRLETLAPKQLSYEMRLFGCIVRTNLRDVALDMREKVGRLDGSGDHAVLIEDVREGVGRLIHDVDQQLRSLRSLRAQFFQPKRPAWLSELFEYVDEYVSLTAENCMTSVLIHLDDAPSLAGASADMRMKIVARIVAEQRHRSSAGYGESVLAPDGENRAHVHRRSALRKFMTSVLFLDIRKKEDGRGLINIAAGFAAAVAMAFSTAALFWSQLNLPTYTFEFVIAVVIGYVFKDRIKEWLRTYFRRLLAKRLYDYSVEIVDPNTGTALGRCRESFEFLPMSQVPSEVLRYRHLDSASVLEPETKPELVMKYIKDVTLRGKRIASLGRQLNDISDINRWNISRLLLRMSEPREVVATYSTTRDKVVGVACPKTYHVNVVALRSADEQSTKIDRYRLILNKRGVKAMQFIETDRSDGTVHEHASLDGA